MSARTIIGLDDGDTIGVGESVDEIIQRLSTVDDLDEATFIGFNRAVYPRVYIRLSRIVYLREAGQ